MARPVHSFRCMKTPKTSGNILEIRKTNHGAKLVLGGRVLWGSLSGQGYASRMATCYRIAACVCALLDEMPLKDKWCMPEVDRDGFFVRLEEGPSQNKVIELLTKAAQVAGFTAQESV